MPFIDEGTGITLIAYFSVSWGILVETRFVSRWTLWFNVVPLLVMLMQYDLGEFAPWLIGYTLFTLALVFVTGNQWLKQIFGTKSYSALMLVTNWHFNGDLSSGAIWYSWLGVSVLVYLIWIFVLWCKYRMGYS